MLQKISMRVPQNEAERVVQSVIEGLDVEGHNVVVLRYGLSGHPPVPLMALCRVLEMSPIKVATLHHAVCVLMQNGQERRAVLHAYLLENESRVEAHAQKILPFLRRGGWRAHRQVMVCDRVFMETENPFFVFAMHMYYDTPSDMVRCWLQDRPERLSSSL